MNLIFNSRIFYRRLATWTREYMISRYLGLGTSEELFGRLYLESLSLGNMMEIIYGREYADQYSQLLSQFVIALRDLISAQLEGNTEAMNQHLAVLVQNAEDRAAFFKAINPYWRMDENETENLLLTYLQYTIDEANLFASGDYTDDIGTFERILAHTNRMGDAFAQGLYNYITSGSSGAENPSQVNGQCVTYDEMNAIYNIRMFWYELVTWTRYYMLSRFLGVGNSNEIYARLKQVPVEYVNMLKKIFGDKITEDYINLFNNYIGLIDALITAQIEGNADKINEIIKQLYQNADERAAFIASINPYWSEDEWRDRLYNNLRTTIEESTTFLTKDYSRNIDIFSTLLDQAESTSNYFAHGLLNYINQKKIEIAEKTLINRGC